MLSVVESSWVGSKCWFCTGLLNRATWVRFPPDPLIPVSAGKATARAIPGARLHIVKGMGHHMPPGVWHEMVTAIADNAARARA
jgi:pimeloyl-ACP methyl ester carboxylesterase